VKYWYTNTYDGQAGALANFDISPAQALSLIKSPFSRNNVEELDLETLSSILDYGWLSNANRSDLPLGLNKRPLDGFANWSIFDEVIGNDYSQPFDFVGNCMNSMVNKPGKESDWWYDTGM
jgi:hypothetical protein